MCNVCTSTMYNYVWFSWGTGWVWRQWNKSLVHYTRVFQRLTLYGKALCAGWWMESLGEVPRPKPLGPWHVNKVCSVFCWYILKVCSVLCWAWALSVLWPLWRRWPRQEEHKAVRGEQSTGKIFWKSFF